jgi:hypothetical protein
VYNYRRLSILPPLNVPVILCLERKLLLNVVSRTGPGLELATVGVVHIKTLVYFVSFARTGTRPLLTVGSCEQCALGGKGLLRKTGVTRPQLHRDTVSGV